MSVFTEVTSGKVVMVTGRWKSIENVKEKNLKKKKTLTNVRKCDSNSFSLLFLYFFADQHFSPNDLLKAF